MPLYQRILSLCYQTYNSNFDLGYNFWNMIRWKLWSLVYEFLYWSKFWHLTLWPWSLQQYMGHLCLMFILPLLQNVDALSLTIQPLQLYTHTHTHTHTNTHTQTLTLTLTLTLTHTHIHIHIHTHTHTHIHTHTCTHPYTNANTNTYTHS